MLAVFPLNIVILPDETVALHLFEPRYRELFADYKNGKEFVIVYENKNELYHYGTTVVIDQISNEFPDGTVDVIVKGIQAVKIVSFVSQMPNKLYGGVEVERLPLWGNANPKLAQQFKDYLLSIGKTVHKPEPLELNYVCLKLQLQTDVKNQLIAISNENQLNTFLINQMRFLGKIREQETTLNHNFQLN